MERETAVTSNRKAMTEEVIDCWINIWDMRSRDAAITDVILRFKFLKQLLVQITERIELSATGKGKPSPSDVVVVKAQTDIQDLPRISVSCYHGANKLVLARRRKETNGSRVPTAASSS